MEDHIVKCKRKKKINAAYVEFPWWDWGMLDVGCGMWMVDVDEGCEIAGERLEIADGALQIAPGVFCQI